MLPLVTVTLRLWHARRDRLEYGLLRHPLRRELRAHLLQCLNQWLFWALFGAAILVDAFANVPALAGFLFGLALPDRIPYPPLAVALGGGAIVMAALALVPGRRVQVATNLLVAIGAVFLGLQLARLYQPPRDPITIDLPLSGDWAMLAGGRSALVSHHYLHPFESDALDFVRLVDGRGSQGDPKRAVSWHGFGEPVLAPADGIVVSVNDAHPDEPVGVIGQTPGEGNHLILELGERRYAAMAHLKRGSALVRKGQRVRRGQPLAAVGDSGNSLAPHLHFQVQDRPTFGPSARTVPIVFRNVVLNRRGSEQRPVAADLRRGDSIRRVER